VHLGDNKVIITSPPYSHFRRIAIVDLLSALIPNYSLPSSNMRYSAQLCFAVFAVIAVVAFADDDTYINKFTVCDDTSIVVSDISLVCDSPGTYYYGSGKYRNSATCQGGDKAKMQVDFQIQDTLETDGYITLSVQGYGTVETVQLYTQESFCSIAQSTDGATCPSAGSYKIYQTFYWGSQSDDYTYTFTPKVVVGITSTVDSNVFDLGGANTNHCQGDVINDWTVGIRKSMSNSIKSFFATFGILTGSIVAILLAGWCITRQSRTPKIPKAIIVDEDLDEMSYQAIRENQNIAIV
jgi:hypothetical protein